MSLDRDNASSVVALHFESAMTPMPGLETIRKARIRAPCALCAGEDWAIVFCP